MFDVFLYFFMGTTPPSLPRKILNCHWETYSDMITKMKNYESGVIYLTNCMIQLAVDPAGATPASQLQQKDDGPRPSSKNLPNNQGRQVAGEMITPSVYTIQPGNFMIVHQIMIITRSNRFTDS